MELENGFNLKNSFTLGLMFAVLIFSPLKFVPSNSRFSSINFMATTFKVGSIRGSFVSIQEAINEAENGSTIVVPSGIYREHVIVNKTVSLVGENVSATIIDGTNSGTVVSIMADNVSITGFTITNSGWGWTRNGIYVQADNCEVKNNFLILNCHNIRVNYSRNSRVLENMINGNGYGIRLMNAFNCTAEGNSVSGCIGGIHLENATGCVVKKNFCTQNDQGIRMYSYCTYNQIFENNVYDNNYDGMITPMPPNTTFFHNLIFHNNFINNTHPFIYSWYGNVWDNGYPSGGNYWSRYNGTDFYKGVYQNETGIDGIGDKPYAVDNFEADQYPLMHPYGSVRNLDTNLTYLTIQSAIDASETLNGHVISVGSGVYHENVNIHKSLTLVGENQTSTIIDGANVGTVLSINADNVSIAEFTMRNSGSLYPPYGMDCGVYLNHSTGSSIRHCLITNNRIGIYLFFSEANVIEHNVVSSNLEDGMWLWCSGNNVLKENEIANNSYNFGVFGNVFSDFNNTIDTSNTVDGKPIRYLINAENETFDRTNLGVLYLINCFNVTVRNLNLTKNGHGVFCYNVTESKIENVTALENNYGIYLQDSVGNTIDNSRCLNNWVGICLQDSNNNIIENNIAANCEKGISLYEADSNNLTGNNLLNNLYGIRFYSSHLNIVFHNNLIENDAQASLYYSDQNVWDNGFEGNFWSDYNGSDINRDGLGDDYYFIDGYSNDSYPLAGAFSDYRVYYEGSFYDVQVISNSTIISFVFEAANDTIRLTVNGTDGTFGFCRICVPHSLIEPEISVIIDNGLTEPVYTNYTLRDDGSSRWIYFAYRHSVHEIIIVPEFVVLPLLLTLMFVTLCCLLIKRLRFT
jgi:parallel beta-helix repeat protein